MDHQQALRFKTVEKVVLIKPKDTTWTLCPSFIMILTSPRDIDELSFFGKESAARWLRTLDQGLFELDLSYIYISERRRRFIREFKEKMKECCAKG